MEKLADADVHADVQKDFHFCGTTPQADRDIWFIHEGAPPSRLVTGAWGGGGQIDPKRPLTESHLLKDQTLKLMKEQC